ncbi:MAG TPA: S8 family serine peptidase [Kiritimatiellia bacterium]|mgnify:CR=1 FL=1|nr:S8 family serine peptidase [Kiritimatiellia bacterium]
MRDTPVIRSRLRRGAGVVLALALCATGLARAQMNDIGATALWAELGTNSPTGAGITVGLVEGVSGGYLPDFTDPEFAGKTFHDVTLNTFYTSPSGHATTSGRRFFGLTSSVAPGVTEIDCYESGHWLFEGFLNTKTGTDITGRGPPLVLTRRVYNFSVVALGNWSNGQRRLDYAVDRDGFVMVGAIPNDPPGPSVVGGMLASAYNVITVGRSDGEHAPGFTEVDTPGRSKPDLVAPLSFTSFATPLVAGAAAMLLEVVDANPALAWAGRPQTIKAILLAGATRTKFPGWSRTPGIPLDDTFGAGELNVYNSYHVLTAGRQAPDTNQLLSTRGWDYQTPAGAATNLYFFEVPAGQWMAESSTALTWHRKVTDADPGPDFIPEVFLADLDLRLLRVSNNVPVELLDQSTSRVDNVEFIVARNLRPGRYALAVAADAGAEYGLAWNGALMPVASGGPFTLTAHSEVHHQLTATPASITPQSGTGATNDPFVFHLGDEALDMDAFAIRSTFSNHSAFLSVPSLTYSPAAPTGGVFDFSGALRRGNLRIESEGAVAVRRVETHSTSAGNGTGGGGNVTIHAAQGIAIADVVRADATGSNNRGGLVRLESKSGPVAVGGLISSLSAAYAGSVSVAGTSVSVSNVTTTSSSASRPGGAITLESTGGSVVAASLRSSGGSSGGPGPISLRAATDLHAASVEARYITVNSSSGLTGASLDVQAGGQVVLGPIDLSILRTNGNNNIDNAGSARILAGGSIILTGAISTRVSSLPTNATVRSRGGPIVLQSTGGDVEVGGLLDASSPAGIWNNSNWNGAVSISAPTGGIVLKQFDVGLLGRIALTASVSRGTTVLGPLIGLDADIADEVVHRFASVRGDVIYDTNVPENAYLLGRIYPIANSVGGSYVLRPSVLPPPEPAVLAMTPAGSAMQAAINGASGILYRLWYTTNLLGTPQEWWEADAALGAGAPIDLRDENPADPARVYRISAE